MDDADIYAPLEDKPLETDDAAQMIGFILAGEHFCVDILMVQEIIKQMPITIVPDTPDFIEGVINLRGNIIPLIDLRKRLNIKDEMKKQIEDPWTIIIDIGGRVAGFIVDQVTRVLRIPSGEILPPPEKGVGGLKSRYLSGVYDMEDQILAILDFRRILVVEEFKKLGAMKRQQDN